MLLYFIILIILEYIQNISKEYINLINWIKANGGYVSEKVKPIELSKSNRIIISSEKIKKNELISYIPEKLIISSINFLANPICRNAYGLNHNQDLECIALFFTLDKENPNSFFKPYYDYLPEFDISVFPSEFTKEEQNLYKELDLDSHIGIHDTKLNNAYNEGVEQLLAKNKIINGFEKYKYYFYLAQTRNFARPNSDFLSDLNSEVPFMDLFNHDINYNLDWEYSDNKRAYFLNAIKDIEPNKELTISYGDIDNMELFTVYGFTLNYNKFKVPIRIKIDGFRYSLYPSEDDNINKKEIIKVFKTLQERYGFSKDKEIFIYNLILNGLYGKKEKINVIKLDNINIRNIVEEEKITISKLIDIIENYYLIEK